MVPAFRVSNSSSEEEASELNSSAEELSGVGERRCGGEEERRLTRLFLLLRVLKEGELARFLLVVAFGLKLFFDAVPFPFETFFFVRI